MDIFKQLEGVEIDLSKLRGVLNTLCRKRFELQIDQCLAHMICDDLKQTHAHPMLVSSCESLLSIMRNNGGVFTYQLTPSAANKRHRQSERIYAGRVYGKTEEDPHRGIILQGSLVARAGLIKNTLFAHAGYVDIDAKKCHPNLMLELGERLGYEMRAYKEYLSNFDEIAATICEMYTPDGASEEQRLVPSDVKKLYTLTLYGGDWNTWVTGIEKGDEKKPWKPVRQLKREQPGRPVEFAEYTEFAKETELVRVELYRRNPDLVKYLCESKQWDQHHKPLKDRQGCVLSYILTTIECMATKAVAEYFVKHQLTNAKTYDWAFDGITLLPTVNENSITDKLDDMNRKVRQQSGFRRIEYVKKPFELTPQQLDWIARRNMMTPEEAAAFVDSHEAAFRASRLLPPVISTASANAEEEPEEEAAPPVGAQPTVVLPAELITDTRSLIDCLTECMYDGGPHRTMKTEAYNRAYERARDIANQYCCVVDFKMYLYRQRKSIVQLKTSKGKNWSWMSELGEEYDTRSWSSRVAFTEWFLRTYLHYTYFEPDDDEPRRGGRPAARPIGDAPAGRVVVAKDDFVSAYIRDEAFRRVVVSEYLPYTYRRPIDPVLSRTVFNEFTPYRYDRTAMTWKPSDENMLKLRLFLYHVFLICGEELNVYNYFVQYLAHIIQYPASKEGIITTLFGNQGCGKDIFLSVLKSILGEKCGETTNPDTIMGNFNAQIKGTIIYCLNEATKTSGVGEFLEKIKSLATEEHLIVNQKYREQESCKVYVRLFRFTNNSVNIDIKDNTDRRNFLIRCSARMVNNAAYFDVLANLAIDEPFLITLMWFLQRVDVESFFHIPRPRTHYSKTVADASRPPMTCWLRSLVEVIRGGFSRMQSCDLTPKTVNGSLVEIQSSFVFTNWKQFRESQGHADCFPKDMKQLKTALVDYGVSFPERRGGLMFYQIDADRVEKILDEKYPLAEEDEKKTDEEEDKSETFEPMRFFDVDESQERALESIAESFTRPWNDPELLWESAKRHISRKRRREDDDDTSD